MDITREEVEHVAKLARLEISEEEKDVFRRQLSAILTYVEQLTRFDTTGVQPTASVLAQHNVFRDDEPRPSLPVAAALANAPDQESGFFCVPKILGER